MSSQERKNQRSGMLASLGIHAGLFLIFFFMMAWRAPNPPLPEYGIELNFGLDDVGGGDIQPENPVGTEAETDQQNEEEATKEEVVQEEKIEETKDTPVKQEEQAISKEESPVVVKEEKKEVKTEKKKETVEETKKEEKKIAETGKDKDVKDAAKKGEQGSQGDDKDKTGDKGDPEGKLDENALYGKQGGGGGGTGFGLAMSGWAWADSPGIPELPDNEDGKVVFEIECDESGEITAIKTIERTLSPRAEQILKDELRKNSLVKTTGGKAPERSTGRVVFILRTK